MSISPKRFAEFFKAVHSPDEASGKARTIRPFPWQERLAARVTGIAKQRDERPWPNCLALPTGSGKTTCLDIAIFALACQADWEPHRRTAPRRIIFVVDRRVIVDEAFEHAPAIARRLDEAQTGILKEVADALRKIAGHADLAKFNTLFDEAPPLTCHQLRGGMYRDDAWARTPTQPCVIASTVDQIGSRLLFRSYGRSFKSWPLHAGLAGNDTLIILDEVHCANPFFQTMEWVERYRRPEWAESPLSVPFQFVVMSATPPSGCNDVMRDDADDRQHPVLGRRINASKPTTLVVASKAKGKAALRELAIELVSQAASLAGDQLRAIVIFANRVATARFVAELLSHAAMPVEQRSPHFDEVTIRQLRNKVPNEFDHVLMIGRMRPADKDQVVAQIAHLSAGGAENRALEKHVFVVATQCLEVGANFDFDALVSECASLDALRQRFGRLNRTGREIDARGVIVIRADQETGKDDDAVYGQSLVSTWRFLNERCKEKGDSRTIDVGVASMSRLWAKAEPEERSKCVLVGPDAPVMLPSHIDCWVQTWPEPVPTPDVSVFLHGSDKEVSDLQVCWRADLPARVALPMSEVQRRDSLDEWSDIMDRILPAVALCPPSTLECISVPFRAFLRWWNDADDAGAGDETSDVEGAASADDMSAHSRFRVCLIWRGPDQTKLLRSERDLRPGDTLVLPVALRGWDVFGHIPADERRDIGDRCCLLARRQAVLRLHPLLFDRWPVDARQRLTEKLAALDEPDRDDIVQIWSDVTGQEGADKDILLTFEALETCASALDSHSNMVLRRQESKARDLGIHYSRGKAFEPKDLADILAQEQSAETRAREASRLRLTQSENFSTEDDTASEAALVTLSEHSEGVSRHSVSFGARTLVCPSGSCDRLKWRPRGTTWARPIVVS